MRRFGFVVGYDEKPKRCLHEVRVNQGIAMNHEVTFMSNGASNLCDPQRDMRPNAEHVLDYFHVAVRITVLQQMSRGQTAGLSAATRAAVAVLESVNTIFSTASSNCERASSTALSTTTSTAGARNDGHRRIPSNWLPNDHQLFHAS